MLPRAHYRLNAPDALDQHPLLRGIEPEVLAQLKTRSRPRYASARSTLIAEGAPAEQVLFVHSGSIRQVTTTADGELTTMIVRAPAVVGTAEAVLARPHTSAIETLEKVTFTAVPAGVLRAALHQSPLLLSRLVRDMAMLLCAMTQRQNALAFCPIEVRVAQALVSLVQAYGVPVERGLRIRLSFSRDFLASLIGVNRRSVARGLKCWFDRGALVRAGRNLVVCDLARLERAGGVPLVHTAGSPHNPWLRSVADLDAHRLYA